MSKYKAVDGIKIMQMFTMINCLSHPVIQVQPQVWCLMPLVCPCHDTICNGFLDLLFYTSRCT